jgi:steroid delta-isomerase-like uncharacterized protein
MPVAENVALMKRWFNEVWNRGRMKTVHELLDKNAIGFGQGGHDTSIHGPADFIPFVERIRAAFPDIKIKVEDVFGAGDRVVVRWSATMTHTGDGIEVPPTNRKVRITGMTIARIVRGKIVEGWDNWDQLALLRQIGAISEGGAEQSHPKLMGLRKASGSAT